MNKLLFFVFCCFGLISTNAAFTQFKVTGIVTSDAGEQMVGVNVVVKGTTIGTITDSEGKFELSAPAGNSVLIISFISYQTLEVPIDNKATLDIVLTQSVTTMEEVVVIGYGTMQKKDITGSIAKVDMGDMQKAPVKSFDEALGGRVAGVQVTSSEGKPGSGVRITIRGGNSITQDNTPLYVIDGFPIENPDNSSLDPSDIESIDVLKDASATAIYGARGANGVIIITTKKGVEGPAKVSYEGFYGFQDNPKRMDVLSPYEYVRLMIEQNPDPAGPTNTYLTTPGKTLDDYSTVAGYNWQDEIFTTSPLQSHRIAINGGNKNTRYNLSVSAYDQKGIIINSGFKRYMGKINLDQTLGEKIKTGINLNYTRSKTYGTSPSDPTQGHTFHNYLFYSVWSFAPVSSGDIDLLEEGFDPNNDPSKDYRFNPVLSAKNEVRDVYLNNLTINTYGEWEIINNLKLKVTGGISDYTNTRENFNNSLTRYGNPKKVEGVNGEILSLSNSRWANENTLTYNFKSQIHNLNTMIGFTNSGGLDKYYSGETNQVPHEGLSVAGMGEGTPVDISTGKSEWRLQSYFGRVFYSFKDRYLITATMRADGSSKFPRANRWGYFPSGSLAWRVSEESFMKSLAPIVTSLKLRASWGMTGNNRVGNYDYFAKLTSVDPNAAGTPQLIYAFDNVPTIGTYNSAIGNSNLKWETTTQTDIGLDLGVVKNRISIIVDLYRKETRDLLLSANLIPSSGYQNAIKNIGQMRNTGLEVSLNTVNIDMKDFKWSTNFNIAFNKNKVIALAENQQQMEAYVYWDQTYNGMPPYLASLNNPLGDMYGYLWDGVYQTDDFDITYDVSGNPVSYTVKTGIPYFGSSATVNRPGQIKYKDISGQDGTPDGKIDALDRTVIGNGLPLHIGGFSNTFEYKGFDLNLFFQWSYGNDILNANRLVMEQMEREYTNQFSTVRDRWTPDNPTNEMFGVKGNPSPAYSSRVVEDGSYIRFKTASLGYTFKKGWTKKININQIRVYATAQNLYTWTKYSGYDPEVSGKNSPLTPGFDYSTYPRERTIIFGIKVNF